MVTINRNTSNDYSLLLTPSEAITMDEIGLRDTNAFKVLVEEWMRVKAHDMKTGDAKNLVNKYLSAASSDQQAIKSILNRQKD